MNQEPGTADPLFEPCVIQSSPELIPLAQHVYATVGNRALITGFSQESDKGEIHFSAGGYRYVVTEVLYDTQDPCIRMITGVGLIKVESAHNRPAQELGLSPFSCTFLMGDFTGVLDFNVPNHHEGILLSCTPLPTPEKPPVADPPY
jgi:hypothetical protein